MTNNLKGKTVVVIGGSSGIGEAVAQMAAQLGAEVLLTGRDTNKAANVASRMGNKVKAFTLDINDEHLVNSFFNEMPSIDHIYIAAGGTHIGSITEGPLNEHMLGFDTRLLGSLRIVRASAGKINPSGSVTFTGGVSTERPIAGAWVSGLATAAAEQLARVLVMELPHIRFNAVSPGYTDTPMWDNILGGQRQSILANVAKALPVKRIATATEVASAVIFLMTNGSVTGETIHVDGGARLI